MKKKTKSTSSTPKGYGKRPHKDAEPAPGGTEAAVLSLASSSSSSDDDYTEDEIKLYGTGEVGSGSSSSSSSDEEDPKNSTTGGASSTISKNYKEKERSIKEHEIKEENGKEVQVSFDVSDPEENFFFGIRSLLQWLEPEGVNITALADLIVEEKGLGSIIHCTAETDVFAFATTLSLAAHEKNEGIQSLCDKLLRPRCPPTLKKTLEHALGSPETFVFLHARFVNLPLPLVPVLHSSSEEDRAWAQSNDATFPAIKNLITLSPCSVDLGRGNNKNASSLPYAPNEAIYDRFEDELLVQAAEMNYCFARAPPQEAKKKGTEPNGKYELMKDGESDVKVAVEVLKKRKRSSKVGAKNEREGGESVAGQGVVISLIETKKLSECLRQMKEMVG